MNKTIIDICRRCNTIHEAEVKMKDFEDWKDGKHIQDALPNIPIDLREILLFEICNECHKELYRR